MPGSEVPGGLVGAITYERGPAAPRRGSTACVEIKRRTVTPSTRRLLDGVDVVGAMLERTKASRPFDFRTGLNKTLAEAGFTVEVIAPPLEDEIRAFDVTTGRLDWEYLNSGDFWQDYSSISTGFQVHLSTLGYELVRSA